MSILIKGMEMPKNCNECKFGTWSSLHQTAACKRHDFEPCFKDYSREFYKRRADFCPLVEVSTPHGRLIDADALDYKLGSSDRDIYVRGVLEEDAPTIIEAEGEDE